PLTVKISLKADHYYLRAQSTIEAFVVKLKKCKNNVNINKDLKELDNLFARNMIGQKRRSSPNGTQPP
ncbi:13151_t:CDS:2, partial [Entrophospora sp. SA101]